MDISKLLKDYRKKNNLTQEYVAHQLNISRQAISVQIPHERRSHSASGGVIIPQ